MPVALKPTFALRLGSLDSSTERPVGGPVRFDLQRGMGGAAESLQVELMAREGVAAGDDATLELGFDGETEIVFTGHVVELQPTLAGVRVLALGRMDKLLRLRTAQRWDERDAGAIVRDLADAAGVDVGQIDSGPTLPRYAMDGKLNAAAHLRQLAARLGFELYTHRDGSLQFRALGAAANLDSAAGGLGGALAGAANAAASAAASLLGVGGGSTGYEVGKNLFAAAASRRAESLTEVLIGGEGPASSHGNSSSWWLSTGSDTNHGSAGGGDAKLLVLDAAARTQDLAQRFAAGQLATEQRSAHRLHLRSFGRAALELGDDVGASGAADELLNASGYVCGLRHRFGPDTGFVSDIVIQAEAAA